MDAGCLDGDCAALLRLRGFRRRSRFAFGDLLWYGFLPPNTLPPTLPYIESSLSCPLPGSVHSPSSSQHEQLLMIVIGTAGTGKSYFH
jgi:hypothetical protein